MAISDTITSMQNHLKSAYDKVSEKGGTVPSEKNMANLTSAIDSVKYTDFLLQIVNRTVTECVDDTFTKLGAHLFESIYTITKIDCPNVLEIGAECCEYTYKLTDINLPKCQIVGLSAFRYNNGMTKIDLPSVVQIRTNSFYSNTKFKTLIIRTTSQVCTLENANAFANTPIATSTTEGFIYVPDDLVESYKSATNWSTYASKIKPISDLGE